MKYPDSSKLKCFALSNFYHCRDRLEYTKSRSKSSSASRRVVLVQRPLKVEGEAENKGKQDGLAVLIKNGLVDNVNSAMGDLGDTELNYEASDDDIGNVVNENEKTSEPGNSRDENMKILELENRVKGNVNEFIELENRSLKMRNEELLRENVNLVEEGRYLRGEKKTLEKANLDLRLEIEDVKWENDHLKQKNTQLVEGMLQLRAKLQGAVDVVDTMEVLQDEVPTISINSECQIIVREGFKNPGYRKRP